MAAYMYAREVTSTVDGVKNTFSSWDNCMSKTYCKWPVIVAIVVGALILLSVLFCVARCICCGVELCSCCVSCCSCCGSCCKGDGRGRDRPSKYADDYTRMPPTHYQGYQPAPSPMAYGGNPHAAQFATFDDPSSKRLLNEDNLPAMPSWDTAAKRRVEDTSVLADPKNGDLELGRLGPQGGRNGYSNVPSPAFSPNPAQSDYFHNTGMNQSYNSDLGNQRLLGDHEHNSFQPVPLSPPPTYRSTSNAPTVAGNHFISGAAIPSQNEYSRGQQYQPQQKFQPQRQPSYQDSYAPSSTMYEPSHNDHITDANRLSMPMPCNPVSTAQIHPSYQPMQTSPQDVRSPGFLPMGRKPVNGSYREV